MNEVTFLGGKWLGESPEHGEDWYRVDLHFMTGDDFFAVPMLWHPKHEARELREAS